MSPSARLHRSYLYAPGSSQQIMEKALASEADAVVCDLEDAVAPERKADARAQVAAIITAYRDAERPELHVRVNRGSHGYDVDDLRAVVRPGLDALRLPKVEQRAEVAAVAALLGELEPAAGLVPGSIPLYLTVESAAGVLALADVLAACDRIARVGFGAADLLADIGATGDEDLATLHARSHVVLVSRARNVGPPIDSVHTNLEDDEGLQRSARRARSLGFFGKSVIHPRQLDAVHAAFTFSDEELAWAERVVAALERAEREGRGASALEGAFVDAAIAARARGVLARRTGR